MSEAAFPLFASLFATEGRDAQSGDWVEGAVLAGLKYWRANLEMPTRQILNLSAKEWGLAESLITPAIEKAARFSNLLKAAIDFYHAHERVPTIAETATITGRFVSPHEYRRLLVALARPIAVIVGIKANVSGSSGIKKALVSSPTPMCMLPRVIGAVRARRRRLRTEINSLRDQARYRIKRDGSAVDKRDFAILDGTDVQMRRLLKRRKKSWETELRLGRQLNQARLEAKAQARLAREQRSLALSLPSQSVAREPLIRGEQLAFDGWEKMLLKRPCHWWERPDRQAEHVASSDALAQQQLFPDAFPERKRRIAAGA